MPTFRNAPSFAALFTIEQALHVAASEGYLEVVKLLLTTDIHKALWDAAFEGRLKVVNLLIAEGITLREALHVALHISDKGHPEIVEFLRANDVTDFDIDQYEDCTPRQVDCETGNIVPSKYPPPPPWKYLRIRKGSEKAERYKQNIFRGAIQIAASKGHTEIVRLLISEIYPYTELTTALNIAISKEHNEIISMLRKCEKCCTRDLKMSY